MQKIGLVSGISRFLTLDDHQLVYKRVNQQLGALNFADIQYKTHSDKRFKEIWVLGAAH